MPNSEVTSAQPDPAPDLENVVISEFFDRWCAGAGQNPAIIEYSSEAEGSRTLSFGELARSVSSVATALASFDVKKGDVVSVQLPNWWEFVAVYLACVRLGAVFNPIMPIFRHRELRFILEHAEAKVLICPHTYKGFAHWQLAERLKGELAGLAQVFFVRGGGATSFEQRLLNVAPDPAFGRGSALQPDDILELLYTSGTTGTPKGVRHSSNSMLSPLMRYIERMELGAGDTGFMPAPFAHQIGFAYGITVALVTGTPLVTMDLWDPAVAVKLMQDHGVTFTFAPTPFLADLSQQCRESGAGLPDFRLFATAGAPIPPVLVAEAEKYLGGSVIAGWGMTECALATSTLPGDDMADKSDGVPYPGIYLQVVDEEGNEVAPGQEGNLYIRGNSLMVGYLKSPPLSAAENDGWFATGDLARMDEQGYIRITGRKKDIVIRGGENLPVVEIENTIHKMAEIVEVAIVGMPDARLGERACAFVTLKPGASLSLQSVADFLEADGFAKQFWPERLEIVAQMPHTPSGKIQKVELRERAKKF